MSFQPKSASVLRAEYRIGRSTISTLLGTVSWWRNRSSFSVNSVLQSPLRFEFRVVLIDESNQSAEPECTIRRDKDGRTIGSDCALYGLNVLLQASIV